MTTPIHLKTAESPAKADLLAMLDTLRTEVESGETIALVAVPVHVSREWSTRSAGEVSMLMLAGMLGRAWMDATEALKT